MARKIRNMYKTANKKAVAASTAIVATASQAAVTVDPATGALTGSIDTSLYTSGIPIVIGFIAFTLGVGAVIGLLKRAK